jgi:hypothetical protein
MKKLVNAMLFSSLLISQAMATGKIDFVSHPDYFWGQKNDSRQDALGGAITNGSKGGLKKDLDIKERYDSIADTLKAQEEKEKLDKATVNGSKGGLQKGLESQSEDDFMLKILELLRRENSKLGKPESNFLEPEKGNKEKTESGQKKFVSEADQTPSVEEGKCDDKVEGFAIANLLKLRSP